MALVEVTVTQSMKNKKWEWTQLIVVHHCIFTMMIAVLSRTSAACCLLYGWVWFNRTAFNVKFVLISSEEECSGKSWVGHSGSWTPLVGCIYYCVFCTNLFPSEGCCHSLSSWSIRDYYWWWSSIHNHESTNLSESDCDTRRIRPPPTIYSLCHYVFPPGVIALYFEQLSFKNARRRLD